MRPRRSALLSLTALAILSGCGTTNAAIGNAGTSARAITSGTPPGPGLIVVVEGTVSQATIRLLREDGSQAGQLPVKGGAQVVGAAGSRIFLITNDQLFALHADGSREPLGTIPRGSQGFWPSPDGSRWIWTSSSPVYDGYKSAIYMAGKGISSRAIQTLTDPVTWLLPVSWTPQGIFIQRMGGIDGNFVFGLPVISPVERIDPGSNSASVVNGSTNAYKVPAAAGCAFADEADDGTVACFVAAQHPVLRLLPRSRAPISIPLSTPRFNYTGDAYFSADGKWLTVCGAVGVSGGIGNPNPQPEEFGADLVTVADGSIVRLTPDRVRLAMGWRSWLPDGRLLLWRPAGAAGGAPGLFVFDPANPNGTPLRIGTTGQAIGYITA